MSEAKSGDTVRIHYTGKLDDGTQFDSSSGREPLEFALGQGQVIAGLEVAVEGMTVGDTKSIRIEPDDAYGKHQPDLVQEIPRSALPDEIQPNVGMALQSESPEGHITELTVTGVTDDSVTLDANHPLAGQALGFDIELVEII